MKDKATHAACRFGAALNLKKIKKSQEKRLRRLKLNDIKNTYIFRMN
jgi:hypothetical protein